MLTGVFVETRGNEILCTAGSGLRADLLAGNMYKVYFDCFSFLCEIKELLFMNDMGEGALVVQYLIAETGLQAQENEGYLRLIAENFHCYSLFQREKRGGQRERR